MSGPAVQPPKLTTEPYDVVYPKRLTQQIGQIFQGKHIQNNLVADCNGDWTNALADAYNQHTGLVNFRDAAWALLTSSRDVIRAAAKSAPNPQDSQGLEALANQIDTLLNSQAQG